MVDLLLFPDSNDAAKRQPSRIVRSVRFPIQAPVIGEAVIPRAGVVKPQLSDTVAIAVEMVCLERFGRSIAPHRLPTCTEVMDLHDAWSLNRTRAIERVVTMLSRLRAGNRTGSEWLAHCALVALIIAIATNVAMALTLKARLNALQPAPVVKTGVVITEITATDASGANRTIQLTGTKPTVLYVSKRGCRWCQRNERNVHAIGLQASTRFRILELSPVDAGPSGAKAFGIERIAVSEDVLQRIGARGTPYLILLSPEGRVIDSWFGAFGSRTAPAIARALQVELPGLIP